jgi:hypothetical protein
VRIPLAQPKNKPQARLRRHSARRRSKKTFHEAVPVKTSLPGRRTRAQVAGPTRRGAEESLARGHSTAPSPTPIIWPQFGQAFAARWWVLLILFLILGVAAYASSDERFFVYDARISGVQHLDPQAIYSAAGVDKQSIFWIDPQRVAESIARVQGVKAVHVRLALPSAVTIEVEERQPVVLWRSSAQKRDWWLDSEGVVLPYHGDPSAAATIFVVDYSDRQLEAGTQIQPADVASSVLQMAASLSGVRVFFYDADRGLYFTQQAHIGEWPVYVGDCGDLARKIQVAELLSKHFEDHNLQPAYVDVRWADRPVYRLPPGGSSSGGN